MRIELTSMKDVLDFLSLFDVDKRQQAKEVIKDAIVEKEDGEKKDISTDSDYVVAEPKLEVKEPEPKKTRTKKTKKEKEDKKPEPKPEEDDNELDIKQECRILVRQCLANNMRSKVLECMADVDVTSISTASDEQLVRLKEKLEEALA